MTKGVPVFGWVLLLCSVQSVIPLGQFLFFFCFCVSLCNYVWKGRVISALSSNFSIAVCAYQFPIKRGCTNSGRQVDRDNKFCTVAPKFVDCLYRTCVISPFWRLESIGGL